MKPDRIITAALLPHGRPACQFKLVQNQEAAAGRVLNNGL
jgi:hypothetical protein